jgi:hypothetical protein
MRPTNFCHQNEPACTRTSLVPSSLRDFHRVDLPRSLGLRATLPGDRVLHGTRERFGGSQLDTRCRCLSSSDRIRLSTYALDSSVGVIFPRRLLPTEPLTPLSPLPLPWNVGTPSRLLQLWLRL